MRIPVVVSLLAGLASMARADAPGAAAPAEPPPPHPTASRLNFVEISGQVLMPADPLTATGFGVALGARRDLRLRTLAIPFVEAGLGYDSVGEIFGGAMLGFSAHLAAFVRLEASVGYDGVGFGIERTSTHVVVDPNLLYGGRVALEGRVSTLSIGLYGRNDDVTSYELRAEAAYHLCGDRTLFARLASYENAGTMISLGFRP